MTFIEKIQAIEKVDSLLKRNSTGNANELALKLLSLISDK
ncbi:MAG: hypothetical protein ACI86M_001803 [Saprospiraceae bacterium]|jgi:hypothetical protein